jgi:hypothetical protein
LGIGEQPEHPAMLSLSPREGRNAQARLLPAHLEESTAEFFCSHPALPNQISLELPSALNASLFFFQDMNHFFGEQISEQIERKLRESGDSGEMGNNEKVQKHWKHQKQ